MAPQQMDKTSFMHMAKVLGLDATDPRMEEVYALVLELFKTVSPLDELNLADVDPYLLFAPRNERSNE